MPRKGHHHTQREWMPVQFPPGTEGLMIPRDDGHSSEQHAHGPPQTVRRVQQPGSRRFRPRRSGRRSYPRPKVTGASPFQSLIDGIEYEREPREGEEFRTSVHGEGQPL